jgi:hypothetical protein
MALTKVRGAGIDASGQEIILDSDQDTTLSVDTDDQIDFKIGGNDTHVFDANGHITLKQFLDDTTAGAVITGASNRGNNARVRLFQSASGSDGGEIRFDTANSSNSMTERMRIAGKGYQNTGAIYFGNYVGAGNYDDPGFNNTTGITFRDINGTHPAIMTCGSGQHYIAKVTTGKFFEFQYKSSLSASGSTVGAISTNGSSTTFETSSDYRLKENVVTAWDATTRLKQLKPSRFNFKVDKDTTVDGFLAHEVSSIVPEAITGEKDAVDENGNPQYQGIDQSKLVPLLTKALQEAMAKIETLEAKVTALESK